MQMRTPSRTTGAGLALAAAILLMTLLAIAAWVTNDAQAQGSIPGKPARPTADSVSHDSVTFSWADPSDSSITGYQVLRRNRDTDAKGDFTVIADNTGNDDTTYTDDTVEASTKYGCRVKARSGGGLSPRSNALRVNTPAAPAESPTPTPTSTPAPTATQTPTATPTPAPTQAPAPAQVRSVGTSQNTGDSPVTITWGAASGATKYQVERQTVPAEGGQTVTFDVDTAATSFQDSGTEYSTKYSYRVRGGNAAGYGPWSDGARITTQRKPGTPDKPGSVAVSQNTTTGDVVITWEAPQGTETVSGYSVHRLTVNTGAQTEVATLNSDARTHTDSDVETDTWYTYWVFANNSHGDSPRSSLRSIHVQDVVGDAPDPPDNLEVSEETAGQVVLTWTAPTTGTNAPTRYVVYRQTIGSTSMQELATVDAPATAYTDSTVEPETLYGYQVTSATNVGESAYEGPRAIRTKVQTSGVPNEPTGVDADEDTNGEVTVSWNAPSDGPARTGFQVYRKRLTAGGDQPQGDVLLATVAGDYTSYTDTTVAGEVTYQYSVRAVNDAGASGAVGPAGITTQAQNPGAPPAPDGTTATQ